MKTINMSVSETRANLIQTLNQSGLPISVMELLVGELLSNIKQQSSATLQKDVAEDARTTQAQNRANEQSIPIDVSPEIN